MYEWYDFVGNVGVLLILASYLLLQQGRLDADAPVYSFANAAGALLILISLWYEFNLSAFVIELSWLFISLYGLWRSYKRRVQSAKV